MKSTNCDAVALTTDLFACLIETKEERSTKRELQQLILSLTARPAMSESDEQVLSLP